MEGDEVQLSMNSRMNSAEWEWTVSAEGATANGPEPRSFRVRGSTERGQMYPGEQGLSSAPLARSLQAEIDLFILQHMDGIHSEAEIAAGLVDQFGAEFKSIGMARDRVRELTSHYGNAYIDETERSKE